MKQEERLIHIEKLEKLVQSLKNEDNEFDFFYSMQDKNRNASSGLSGGQLIVLRSLSSLAKFQADIAFRLDKDEKND